jgi:hypothetical protein
MADDLDMDLVGALTDFKKEDPTGEVVPHLRDPFLEPEETFGPVPPTAEEPYTTIDDPLARDTSPLPTSPISRG